MFLSKTISIRFTIRAPLEIRHPSLNHHGTATQTGQDLMAYLCTQVLSHSSDAGTDGTGLE